MAGGGRPSFGVYYLLWLNLERQRLAQAVAVCRGVGLATSGEPVPLAYCEAVSDDAAEAAEVKFQTDAARQMARVMARKR